MKMRQVTLFVIWAVAVPAVAGGVIMALWNVLMPGLFGLAVISFWQAVGMFLLSQLLTGGFVLGLILLAMGMHIMGMHHNHAVHRHWTNMTDAERSEVLRRCMSRFGNRNGSADDNGQNAGERDGGR